VTVWAFIVLPALEPHAVIDLPAHGLDRQSGGFFGHWEQNRVSEGDDFNVD
jgi:hypothetical protein